MSRYSHQVDGNQSEIVRKLRKLPGVSVAVTSMVGSGFVDLVIGYRLSGRSENWLIELKDPAQQPCKRVLTEKEAEFHAAWKGPIGVAETFEDVLRIIGILESR